MDNKELRLATLIKRDSTSPYDRERLSMFYILAYNNDLFHKISYIYDFMDHSIITECIDNNTVDLCSSSLQLIKLAFNHFNSYPCSVNEVFSILDQENSLIALDSIKIRYNITNTF